MVTIHNLEVHLEVDGAEQESAFVRLFEKYIRRWHRAMEEEAMQRRRSERERRLSGSDGDSL